MFAQMAAALLQAVLWLPMVKSKAKLTQYMLK